MRIRGSCLCKAVQYEIDALASAIGFCHCSTCRKAHAAQAAPTARVEPQHFRWLLGQDMVRDFVSSPGKVRQFCGQCGSHIIARKAGQAQLILRVATLDDDPGARPVVHIWTSHDVAWLDAAAAPRLPEAVPG